MKILSYECRDTAESNWSFSRAELQEVNLLVGNSSAGKTRFLNTIFNLGASVARDIISKTGSWNVELEQEGRIYIWDIEINKEQDGKLSVKKETLWERVENQRRVILARHEDSFRFQNDDLPKLSRQSTSLSLLKEEEAIKPLYQGFHKIMRRRFFAGELEEVTKYQIFFNETEINDLSDLFDKNFSVNWKLDYLDRRHPDLFRTIREQYMQVFPFIEKIEMRDLNSFRPGLRATGRTPVFSIKEKHVDNWLPIGDLSSGMQKVLLILTDVYTFPSGGIYLLDEYENSLGINAINFFPTLLTYLEKEIQFIITSHHPYLINNIPAENWLVFHRKGSSVTIKYGKENIERYGKSKQQRFIQLLNDPFFNEGME